ncbi:hypothetical protein LIER_26043 [Lithospermum erythrorhizon]|uniref:Uncharacterized protein n=1 Tax=Lithospermum erythrorhizon TaxID=34254 RepID=A0AAV3R8I3_LITER
MEHADIPSDVGTDDLTTRHAKDDVTQSATDTDVDVANLLEEMAKPAIGEGVDNTMNADIEDMRILEDVGHEKEKVKENETQEWRAERKARKAAEKVVEKEVVEEQVPVDVRPIGSDIWNPADEQPGDGNDETDHRFDDEDVAAVMSRRRKAKSKLKINENRTRVGNKRVSKNIDYVSTNNVVLNTNKEKAKWKFLANGRIAAERMLSEATKKNANIMGILEDAGVMPTIKIVGPYYPKIVRELICNMRNDIDDPKRPNIQKVTLRNYTIDFSLSIINGYYAKANRGGTRYNLQLSGIVKVLTGGSVDTWPTKRANSLFQVEC